MDIPANETAERSQFAQLQLHLEARRGRFAITVVRVNDPGLRDGLIDRLESWLVGRGQRIARLDYSTGRPHNLLDALRRDAAGIDASAVISITGLEHLLVDLDEGEAPRFARFLNADREAFRSVSPVPLVLWLTDFAADKLAEFAPDFMDWATVFRFTAPVTGAVSTRSTGVHVQGSRAASRAELLEAERARLVKRQDDPLRLAMVLVDLGGVYLGDADNRVKQTGISHLEEARRMLERAGRDEMLWGCLAALGTGYFCLGDLVNARARYEEAAAIAKRAGNPERLARTEIGLAQTVKDQGDDARAIALLKEAARHARTAKFALGEAHAHKLLGHIAAEQRNWGPAIESYHDARAIYSALRDARGLVSIAVAKASVHVHRGEWKLARAELDAAAREARNARDPVAEADVAHQRALLARAMPG